MSIRNKKAQFLVAALLMSAAAFGQKKAPPVLIHLNGKSVNITPAIQTVQKDFDTDNISIALIHHQNGGQENLVLAVIDNNKQEHFINVESDNKNNNMMGDKIFSDVIMPGYKAPKNFIKCAPTGALAARD
jgi:hypothetical protein